jgi:sensor histidine kinase YesM
VAYGVIFFFARAKLLFSPKWYTALYSALVLEAIFVIVDIVVSGIMTIFKIPVDAYMTYGNDRIVYIVLAKLVSIFFIYLVIKLSQWRKSQESLLNAVPLLLCQVFSIFICYIMYLGALRTGTEPAAGFLIGTIGVLYINIVIFLYVERIKKVSEIKKENELAEQQYKSKLEYFEQVKDDQQETRALWHDIKKYLNTMNELMNANDIAHARECITQVSDLFQGIGKVVDVGNTVISAVLNHSIQKARRLGIETSLDVRVRPDLKISAADLSVIIGNTFDNAIEACDRIIDGKRQIAVSLIEKNMMLLYEITNTFDPAAPTVKENPKRHGFGLKNVKRCIDKYRGNMAVESEGTEFKVSIHINVPVEFTSGQLVS